MKRPILLVAALAIGAAPLQAAAQAPSPPAPRARLESSPNADASSAVRRAQSHFQRGVQLYEEENYDGAFAEFSRAHELAPNYRLLYNLAQTEAERHDYVHAVTLFDDYLEQGGDDIPPARRQSTTRERDDLLGRIASLQVECNVGGAELWLDGRSRGIIAQQHALRLNAGPVELRLQKPGYGTLTRQLILTGGDALVVDLALERTPAALVPDVPRSSDEPAAAAHTGVWLSAAATTLFAGATATFALLTANQNDRLDRQLEQYQADSSDLDGTRSRVRTYAAFTDGFGVATALSLGSMFYFIVSDAGGGDGRRERAADAARNAGVRVLFGRSGVALRTSF
jgi:tetratricopeptide (TPR) repeat protein